MAEDQIPEPLDARSQRSGPRPPPTMSIHLPPQVSLADAAPRLSPKLTVNGQDEISALRLAVPIVRRWPIIVGSAAVLGALAVALTLILPARYTARTSFTVESSSNSLTLPRGLSGIAGELGAVLGSASPSGPPIDYFSALAISWRIREAVVSSHYTRDGRLTDSAGTPLLDMLGITGDMPARRVEDAVRQLGQMIKPEIDRKGGIVTIRVEDRDPVRAAAIANRLIELVNKYNVEQRQSRSRQQRELAERRLALARSELRAAEEQLQDFLSRNRAYRSPLLIFQEKRLGSAVDQKQELVTMLAQTYEEARISEAGDIPAISVIDGAVVPTRRSFPVRWQFLLAGLFFGGIVGLVLAYLLEAKRTWTAEQQPDFLALRDAARAWKARLRGHTMRG
jgi:uncharacterized protein involved in exopolysaccharide biosynthesis